MYDKPEADKRVNRRIVEFFGEARSGRLVGVRIPDAFTGRPEAVMWVWCDRWSKGYADAEHVKLAVRHYADIIDGILRIMDYTVEPRAPKADVPSSIGRLP